MYQINTVWDSNFCNSLGVFTNYFILIRIFFILLELNIFNNHIPRQSKELTHSSIRSLVSRVISLFVTQNIVMLLDGISLFLIYITIDPLMPYEAVLILLPLSTKIVDVINRLLYITNGRLAEEFSSFRYNIEKNICILSIIKFCYVFFWQITFLDIFSNVYNRHCKILLIHFLQNP